MGEQQNADLIRRLMGVPDSRQTFLQVPDPDDAALRYGLASAHAKYDRRMMGRERDPATTAAAMLIAHEAALKAVFASMFGREVEVEVVVRLSEQAA